MTLVKFNSSTKNNNALSGYNDVFDSVFNDTFFKERVPALLPAANICETEDHYHVELAAPGLKKDYFKLQLEGNILSISAESDMNNNDQKNYSKREFSYRSFVRKFTLPESADESRIEATYTDGILKIDIAKREEAKKVQRMIEIK